MIYAVNLLIMLGWALVTGDFSSGSLVFGFLVGFGALWIASGLFGESRYHARLSGVLGLFLFFIHDLVQSSLMVAWDVLTPRLRARPAFVEMPLEAETDVEIVLVANLISLTPGTLSIDVSADRKTLLVHAMFADDPAAVVSGLKSGMERRVLEALR